MAIFAEVGVIKGKYFGKAWTQKLKSLSILLGLSMYLVSCSQDSNSLVARKWHNLLAHYNGYFLANEKIKEVEQEITTSHIDNYNRVLEVFPTPKKGSETALAPKLLEAIKKASLPIQRHKNSDWVDDSYFVIGKARFYDPKEYDQALATFKFVNSKSKDRDLRHKALIWLARTYLLGNEYENAQVALDYLKKQKMKPLNLREFYVVHALYHYKQREYKQTADYLKLALPYMILPSDRKARFHFIIAQCRQREGEDSAAFHHYKRSIYQNPSYEMSFNAKLYLAQVTSLNKAKDIKRVNKYFTKLLKDKKNEEYKDKIYYEWGRFEQKQNHLQKAIEYYQTSVKSAGPNPNIKAYSYLRIAEINYDTYKKYAKAKLYYDSSLTSLDTLEENYLAIKKRKKILDEFVKHWEVVEKEDSLQKLARMDSVQRFAKIDKLIAEAEEKAEKAEKEKKRLEKEAKSAFATSNTGANTQFDPNKPSGFNADAAKGGDSKDGYFSNPLSVSSGSQEFKRKWGNRPLEDDWRRSQKESSGLDATVADKKPGADGLKKEDGTSNAASADSKSETKGGKDDKKGKDGKEGEAPPLSQAEKRAPYLEALPLTPEKMEASNVKLREALFNLAKVYEQQLGEHENAINCLERVSTQFPGYEKVPESHYYLYLLHGREKHDNDKKRHQDSLLDHYSESVYARLILNPNYLVESRETNKQVSALYNVAFEYYKEAKFVEADKQLAAITAQYPDNEVKDRLDLLRCLIVGRTLDRKYYLDTLKNFIKAYPKSKLKKAGEELLANAEAFINKNSGALKQADSLASIKKKTPYTDEDNATHMFVVLLPADKGIDERLVETEVIRFNSANYPEVAFTTSNLLLGDDKYFMVTVRDFKSRIQALNYLKKQRSDKGGIRNFKKFNPITFLITLNNYPLFYRAKDVPEYLDFFNSHYDLQLLELPEE